MSGQIITLRSKPKHINGLKELIRDLPEGSMAEIGVYQGESTEVFVKSGKFDPIYAVDPWENGFDDSRCSQSDMKKAERNFDKRVGDDVIKLKMESKLASEMIENVTFVYIDGSHKYEDVKQDIELWKDKCEYLGLHDYTNNDDVRAAANEILGEPDKTYQDTSALYKPKEHGLQDSSSSLLAE